MDQSCGMTCVAAKLLGRNFIGIDISQDAIELTRARLENPIKSSSPLLEKGRDAYMHALHFFLQSIEDRPRRLVPARGWRWRPYGDADMVARP
jgi:hypothetical protein